MSVQARSRVFCLTVDGRGAIAVLLVTGPEAASRVGRHFVSRAKVSLERRPLNRIFHGHWGADNGEDVVVCRRSPTEVEVHCHGGRAASRRIIADLIADGCAELGSPARLKNSEPSPIRAAAIEQLAHARTERAAATLLDQLNGALEGELQAIVARIRAADAAAALAAIDELIMRSAVGLHLTSPWRVVLAGPPNVGKSSLINALVGYKRAIVFAEPGTTRDVVRASTAFDGWPIELSDTAGIRVTRDRLEAAGVELARRQITAADCLVLVTDAREAIDAEIRQLAQVHSRAIVVANKADFIEPQALSREAAEAADRRHLTSAITGQGLPALVSAIVRELVPVKPQPGDPIPFIAEQVERIRAAREALERGDADRAATTLESILRQKPNARGIDA